MTGNTVQKKKKGHMGVTVSIHESYLVVDAAAKQVQASKKEHKIFI